MDDTILYDRSGVICGVSDHGPMELDHANCLWTGDDLVLAGNWDPDPGKTYFRENTKTWPMGVQRNEVPICLRALQSFQPI